ncbi:exodeoxyribonuclease VII large subunit [Haematomicrobium sanguinis]|uniref:exodeoxyribonuclease VII large subunit n=1 Tax=Haematomicrobium sanguinis TaxID=479106 RepID=UPI00047CD823|nr:exodeoxyribonuclease VII large subunit [Haematomicrobium sanguinis]
MGVGTLAGTNGEVKEVSIVQLAGGAPPPQGWVRVHGEIRDLRKRTGITYFALTAVDEEQEEVHTLSAQVLDLDLQRMRSEWKREKPDAGPFPFTPHQDVVFEGKLEVDKDSKYRFHAKKITGGNGTGALGINEDDALHALADFGVDRDRLGAVSQLPNRHPNAWNAPDRLQKLLVIVGNETNAKRDIQAKLAILPPALLEVEYKSFQWKPGLIHDALKDAVNSGVDLVLVATGGGAEAWRHKYQNVESAERIWKARLPVVTALGHAGDVSLADRVASYSFDTPDHAATSILEIVQGAERRRQEALRAERVKADAKVAAEHQTERERAQQRIAWLSNQLEESVRNAALECVSARKRLVFICLLAAGCLFLAFGLPVLFPLPEGQIRHSWIGWIPTGAGITTVASAFVWRSKSNDRFEILRARVPTMPPSNLEEWITTVGRVNNLRDLRKLVKAEGVCPSRLNGRKDPADGK